MKKFLSVLLALIILICAGMFYVNSAESDFEIEDGVLIAYTGSDAYVSIPGEVYYIGDSAFEGNEYVQTVSVNGNVSYIGTKAFYNCSGLQALIGGSGVTSVGAFAFEGTPFLENKSAGLVTLNGVLIHCGAESADAEIPESVTSVAPYAFYGNTSVKSVSFGGDTVEIGEGAFYGCTSLAEIDIPKSVTSIGAYAFYDTPWLNSQSGQVISGDGILIAYNGQEADVTVTAGVKKIAPCAFINNSGLSSVTIPSSVYLIGQQAFMSCSQLSGVSLSSGLVFIDEEAFADCAALSKCYVPKTVEHIGKGAFAGCTSMERLVAGGSLKKIGYGAFAGCADLKAVYLRDNEGTYYTVEGNAFYGCESLNGVRLAREAERISRTAFSNSSAAVYASQEPFYIKEYCNANGIALLKELGDVDGDGDINIADAAQIQLYLAKLTSLNGEQIQNADADYSGKVDIEDVTFIQLVGAKLI